MNIILVPGHSGSGRSSSLPHRHLLVIALVGGLVLPLFLGTLTFEIREMIAKGERARAEVSQYEAELARQASAIERAKRDTQTHLNALARRLGQLQAQVLRLNALGGRLTQMAGLDQREFAFDADVAQGGPEAPASGASLEVTGALERLGTEVKAAEVRLKALETLLLDRRLTEAVTPAGWPATGGYVSSNFGRRADPFTGRLAWHEGVDIAAKLGSPIHAMADGVVSFAGHRSAYGRVVEITHARGLVTRYAHTSELLVKVGDKVERGDPIARVGSSGRSTGPHVHFEVLRDGKQVNPAKYLSAAR